VAARTPAEAVQALLGSLQRATSCVSRAVLITTGYQPKPDPHIALFKDGLPVPMRSHLALNVLHYFTIEQSHVGPAPWQTSTTGYAYTILDAEGHEVVAYHWHPRGRSSIGWPHLHLGAGARVGHAGLADTHLPTGRIMLEDVLHAAITGLDVRPLRTDWERVFEQTRAARDL
jgi:hypothetical protein